MNLFLAPLLDGNKNSLAEGGLVAIMTMVFVFIILAVIILITYYVGKGINKASEKAKTEKPEVKPVAKTNNPLNLDDEDAVVAALVASIDFRNQIKKDVKVVSIKEIK